MRNGRSDSRLQCALQIGSKTHALHKRSGPLYTMITCTCGWSHRESRRQNALGRASKERAAMRKHFDTEIEKFEATEKQSCTSETPST